MHLREAGFGDDLFVDGQPLADLPAAGLPRRPGTAGTLSLYYCFTAIRTTPIILYDKDTNSPTHDCVAVRSPRVAITILMNDDHYTSIYNGTRPPLYYCFTTILPY